MQPHIRPKSSRRRNPLPHGGTASHRAAAGEALEFSRIRVLLGRRQLLADGVPVELGTRAFDLLLAPLEADGSLDTKEELMSRVWPSVVVSAENLKFQVSALRKALGADRDLIHTEFGRGYRFIGVVRVSDATAAPDCLEQERLRSAPTLPSPATPGSSPGRGGVRTGSYRGRRSFHSVNSAACIERRRFSGLAPIGR
jgi:DNA-binding winged helix-turn-helix (wHTH) protein